MRTDLQFCQNIFRNSNGIFCHRVAVRRQIRIVQLQAGCFALHHLIGQLYIFRCVQIDTQVFSGKAVLRGLVLHSLSMCFEISQNRITIHDSEFAKLAVVKFPEQTAGSILFLNGVKYCLPICLILLCRQRRMHIEFGNHKGLSYHFV